MRPVSTEGHRAMAVSIYRLSEHVSEQMTVPEWAPILGKQAVFTTDDGETLHGIVEAPIPGMSSGFPIVRFADGDWGRCDEEVILID
jgi:hypothetical protein